MTYLVIVIKKQNKSHMSCHLHISI